MNSVPGFRDHRSLAGGAVDDARASSQAQSPRERAAPRTRSEFALRVLRARLRRLTRPPYALLATCGEDVLSRALALEASGDQHQGPRATSAPGVAYAQYVHLNAAALK